MSSKKQIPSKIIYLRIAKPAHTQLMRIAEAECRTIVSVIRQAIKEYMERRPDNAS